MDKFEEFAKQLNIYQDEENHQMYFACGYLMATKAIESFVKKGVELGHLSSVIAVVFSKFLDRVFYQDNPFEFVRESYDRFHEERVIREAEGIANTEGDK